MRRAFLELGYRRYEWKCDALNAASRRAALTSEAPVVSGDQSMEELSGELAEARKEHAATSEILRIISNSPTDLQRVFAEIAASATRVCDAYDAVILQVDGELLRAIAHHGPIPIADTLPLTRGIVIGRAVLDEETVHVADLQAEKDEYLEGSDVARRLGHGTIVAVPLIRAGEAIGAISIRRTEVRPFKTFADQAVIAIENTRLFEQVHARTRALTEALEQQTASSEVLSIISTSGGAVEVNA